MVESCGTQISAPAQVANALNRETAQSLQSTKLPQIKNTYYTRNIVKFRDCENFHEEKARLLREREQLSKEFAAFSREQCILNKKQNIKIQKQIKQKQHKNTYYTFKNNIKNIKLKPIVTNCLSTVKSIMIDCAIEETANKCTDLPEKVIKLVPLVNALPPPEAIDDIYLRIRSELLENPHSRDVPFGRYWSMILGGNFGRNLVCFITGFWISLTIVPRLRSPYYMFLCDLFFAEVVIRLFFYVMSKWCDEFNQVNRAHRHEFFGLDHHISYFLFQLNDLDLSSDSIREEDECWFMQQNDRDAPQTSNSEIQSQITESLYDPFQEDYQHTYPISDTFLSKYKPCRQEKKNKARKLKNLSRYITKNVSHQNIQSNCLSPMDRIRNTLKETYGNTDEYEFVIHTVESLYLTAEFLQKAETKKDVLLAFSNLVKHFLPKRAICSSSNIQKIYKIINKLFKTEEIQSSQSDLLIAFRNLLTDYQSVKKAPIFKKVYRLFSYLIALNIFEKVGLPLEYTGYTVLEKELLQKKYHMGPDFIFCVLDTVLFVVERGIQCWKTGEVEPLFHAPSTYVEWFEFTQDLKNRAKLLHDPTLETTSESEFLHDLDSAIEKGESIHKYASRLSDYDRRTVSERLNDLKMIRSEMLCLRFANQSRQVPFSVLVFGESGIGKSTVKDILYYLFCKAQNLPSGDEYKYVRNPVSEFWDGFRSNMHSLFLDDVAFMHPNKAPNGDQSCLEFIQVINAVPFVPNQAALEFKGRTPFRGKLVVATTNTMDLNAHYYFSHPSAVQRRFPYIIIPKPLEKYVGDDGQLDSKKVPPPTPGTYPDLWTFTVMKVSTVPIDKANSRKAEVKVIPDMENVDQKTFFKWYIQAIKQHFENQNKMTESVKMMADVKTCHTCHLPLEMCDCSFQSWQTLSAMAVLADTACKWSLFYRLRRWAEQKYIQAAQTHAYYENLGERIQAQLETPIQIVKLVTFLTSFIISYKVTQRMLKMTLQSSVGISPEGKEERDNPWYKSDFELTDFDISRQTTSWKSLTSEQIVEKIARNTLSITQVCKNNKGTYDVHCTTGLALEGHKVIANLHAFKLDVDVMHMRIIRQSSSNGVNQNVTFSMNPNDVKVYPNHDIVIFDIIHIPPFKRITNLFAAASFNGTGKGLIVTRKENGELLRQEFIRAKRTNNVDYTHYKDLTDRRFIHDVYITQVSEETKKGMCGSPYLMETPQGPVLLGIHIAGKGSKSECLFFDSETIKSFVGKNEIVAGEPALSAESAQREVGDLSKKSVFRYIDNGSASVYGSFTGFKIAPKSRVGHTPMNPFLQGKGYSTKYTSPTMSGWKPWRIAALDLVNPVTDIDMSSLKVVTSSFAKQILTELHKDELNMLTVYDDFTALNGAAGVTYVDKINRSTSAGNPWKKSKKYFLSAIPPRGDNLEPVEASPEIMDRMKEIIQQYKDGKRAHPNFCAHLKDEPVTFAKREIGKTRVFSGAPFDWSLVVRKYFLSSIRVIQRNKFVFEAAPGTICQSSEWGDIYNYLVTFGTDQIVAGDYKAYDKRMPPAFILAAFEVMITLCIESKNFDDEDIRIMRGIAEDTAYPLTDFNGDLVEFYGSNPSGHPLTVIINSLVNSLYMRYVYYMLSPKDEVDDFKKYVKLMTYGDDNIMGVSKEIPWFSHTSIQNTLGRMGITYTMADKQSESVPYIDISKASFLKRTWRYEEELKSYLCPLEHDSIEKSLMVWTRSKTICWEEQAIAVISSAIQEYFFYGEKTYHKRMKLFKDMISDLGIEAYEVFDKHGNSVTFPKYETLVERFHSAGH